MGEELLPYLKKFYTSSFDDVDEESIAGHFKRFALCTFSGDTYGSSLSREERSLYILAMWCALGGNIDTSGSDLRPGIIQFFMEQTKSMDSLLRVYLLLCTAFSHILHGTLVLQWRCSARISLNYKVRPLSFL